MSEDEKELTDDEKIARVEKIDEKLGDLAGMTAISILKLCRNNPDDENLEKEVKSEVKKALMMGLMTPMFIL